MNRNLILKPSRDAANAAYRAYIDAQRRTGKLLKSWCLPEIEAAPVDFADYQPSNKARARRLIKPESRRIIDGKLVTIDQAVHAITRQLTAKWQWFESCNGVKYAKRPLFGYHPAGRNNGRNTHALKCHMHDVTRDKIWQVIPAQAHGFIRVRLVNSVDALSFDIKRTPIRPYEGRHAPFSTDKIDMTVTAMERLTGDRHDASRIAWMGDSRCLLLHRGRWHKSPRCSLCIAYCVWARKRRGHDWITEYGYAYKTDISRDNNGNHLIHVCYKTSTIRNRMRGHKAAQAAGARMIALQGIRHDTELTTARLSNWKRLSVQTLHARAVGACHEGIKQFKESQGLHTQANGISASRLLQIIFCRSDGTATNNYALKAIGAARTESMEKAG